MGPTAVRDQEELTDKRREVERRIEADREAIEAARRERAQQEQAIRRARRSLAEAKRALRRAAS